MPPRQAMRPRTKRPCGAENSTEAEAFIEKIMICLIQYVLKMVMFPTKKSKTSGVVFLIGIDIWCHWSKQKHGKHSDGLPPGHSNEVERATIALYPIKVSLDMTSPTILWNIRLQDYIHSETDWQWSRPKETKLPVSPECSMIYQLQGGEESWMMNEQMNIPIPGTQPLPLFKTKQKFTRQKWYYGAGAGKARKHCFWKAGTTHD